jgi:hypothetical protein
VDRTPRNRLKEEVVVEDNIVDKVQEVVVAVVVFEVVEKLVKA